MKLIVGKNDLATTHPELAKEAHGWNPNSVTLGSNKKFEWRCSKNHIWRTSVIHRSKNKSGCPYCINRKVLVGFNDLATTHPELAKEAHGWDPSTVVAGSHKTTNWLCSNKHEYKANCDSRSRGTGCPYCSNMKVLAGFNDLATTHPELAKEAHGWDPKIINAGTPKKLEWKCLKNHVWRAQVRHRVSGSGCLICGNKEVFEGFNDLATTHPELAKEAHGWDPKTKIAGSGKSLEWICKKNHIWKAVLFERTNGTGCPYCSNMKVLAGFNDLATTHPELAQEALGWDPKTKIAGSHTKMSWRCKENHTWKTSVKHRTKDNSGCPSCATTGFDPNKDGYLYYLIQPQWEIYQIGITNIPDDRIARHKRNGFDLLELRGPMDGQTAQELETAVLRYLKSQKADLSPEHIAGKFDGYTESWTIDSFKVNNLKELIDKASEAGF